MKTKSLKNLILIASLLVNFCMAVIFFTPLTEQLYKPLIVSEPLRKSEAIVILSAGMYRGSVPCYRTLTRLKKGLELYRDKWADKIICIGGKKIATVDKTIAELMKETLILYGVPERDVLVSDKTINSYNDITSMLIKFNKDFDFNNTIFVTSSFHTYRVKKILRKKGIEAAVVSADPYELYPRFWTEKMDLFSMVAREYLVICYFKIKNWI